MSDALEALEQGEAVAKVDMITHMGDGRYHTSIVGNTKLEVGTKLYTAPPSTAEAQARALEDAADNLLNEADRMENNAISQRATRDAAWFLAAEAKRIREEAK